jgi:hypothetical protein
MPLHEVPALQLAFVDDTLISTCPPEPRNKVVDMWGTVEIGADVDTRNYDEDAVSRLAVIYGDVEVLQLLQYNANIDARGQYGRTPLYCASASGHVKVMQFL